MSLHRAFTIYQFIPLTHHRSAIRMVKELLSEGIVPILDLEDSVSCLWDEERNAALKAMARAHLLRMAHQHPSIPNSENILVRINQRDSKHHELDLQAVRECHERGFSLGMVLSKTSSAEELTECSRQMQALIHREIPVIPIIESLSGVNALEEILQSMPEARRIAVFGYFDYALDAGHWPTLNQLQPQYWHLFNHLRNRAERHNGILINSPHTRWQAPEELAHIKAELLDHSQAPTGMCAIHRSQSQALLAEAQRLEHEPATMMSDSEKAQWIIDAFESHRCHLRSFAVHDGYFVTPHEYQLAKRYLDS